MGYGGGQESPTQSGVKVLSKEGEALKEWKVDFAAQSINVGADGTVYVAGSGIVAKFSREGKLLKKLELPHIAEFLKNKDVIRKRAEEEARERAQQMKAFVTASKNRIKRLEKIPADKRTLSDKVAIEQLKTSIQMMEKDQTDEASIDSIVQQITARMRIIDSVAVSNQDVFIVCGESTGYGYSVWRMDHDFGSAKQVMKGLQGCCGQMDVQVLGNDLLVAENCKHSFARFDRDAKKIGEWGGRATGDDDGKCFGGCCNPMNVRPAVPTAISSRPSRKASSSGSRARGISWPSSPSGRFRAAARTWPWPRRRTASSSIAATSPDRRSISLKKSPSARRRSRPENNRPRPSAFGFDSSSTQGFCR